MIKKKIEKLEEMTNAKNQKCAIVIRNENNFHIESLTDSTGKTYLKDVQDFPLLLDLMKYYNIERNEIVLIDLIPN